MKSENVVIPTFTDDDIKIINNDSSKNDDLIYKTQFDKTHIKMSHFNLCESFGSRVLGLSGYSLSAYRLMGSFAINNYCRFNGLYCCFSYIWLANSLNCGFSTAKRVIKSLCDKQIIKKIGSGRGGRNCYKILKIYEFDYLGALMVYYETLNKKSSKRNNLKNKEHNDINNFGLPSWVSYYGNYERFLTNRAVNESEIIQIAKIKWVNK